MRPSTFFAIAALATALANGTAQAQERQNLTTAVNDLMAKTCSSLQGIRDGADCTREWLRFLLLAHAVELQVGMAGMAAAIGDRDKVVEVERSFTAHIAELQRDLPDRVKYYRGRPQSTTRR